MKQMKKLRKSTKQAHVDREPVPTAKRPSLASDAAMAKIFKTLTRAWRSIGFQVLSIAMFFLTYVQYTVSEKQLTLAAVEILAETPEIRRQLAMQILDGSDLQSIHENMKISYNMRTALDREASARDSNFSCGESQESRGVGYMFLGTYDTSQRRWINRASDELVNEVNIIGSIMDPKREKIRITASLGAVMRDGYPSSAAAIEYERFARTGHVKFGETVRLSGKSYMAHRNDGRYDVWVCVDRT